MTDRNIPQGARKLHTQKTLNSTGLRSLHSTFPESPHCVPSTDRLSCRIRVRLTMDLTQTLLAAGSAGTLLRMGV